MNIIIIIQARIGSTRLPGKVLMPLGATTVLDYVVTRCRNIKNVNEVIVATSSLEQDDAIEQWCTRERVCCYRGSEEDVLARYYACAASSSSEYVIRVTADCPFLDYDLGNKMIEKMITCSADLATLNGPLPRGFAVEMIRFTALEQIYKDGTEPHHREHVTYYAYENMELFETVEIDVPMSMRHPKLRVTLDTEEDYQLCLNVADYFEHDKLVPSQYVIDYLLSHPQVVAINAHIEQKPVV